MTVDVHKVVVYKDEGETYRWSARDSNGQVVATPGEGYVLKSHAIQAAQSLFPNATLVLDDSAE